MRSNGIIIPGADADLMDILNSLVGGLLRIIGAFENETLRVKELPLMPFADISIQEELDHIIKLPRLAAVHDKSFLDARIWRLYSFMSELYEGVDATFYELNSQLSEHSESNGLLSISIAELNNISAKIKEAKEAYEGVYNQMSEYRTDKRV